jgi:hypothetical protein
VTDTQAIIGASLWAASLWAAVAAGKRPAAAQAPAQAPARQFDYARDVSFVDGLIDAELESHRLLVAYPVIKNGTGVLNNEFVDQSVERVVEAALGMVGPAYQAHMAFYFGEGGLREYCTRRTYVAMCAFVLTSNETAMRSMRSKSHIDLHDREKDKEAEAAKG